MSDDINRQIRTNFAQGMALRLGFTQTAWLNWASDHHRRLGCKPVDLLGDSIGLVPRIVKLRNMA